MNNPLHFQWSENLRPSWSAGRRAWRRGGTVILTDIDFVVALASSPDSITEQLVSSATVRVRPSLRSLQLQVGVVVVGPRVNIVSCEYNAHRRRRHGGQENIADYHCRARLAPPRRPIYRCNANPSDTRFCCGNDEQGPKISI